MLFHSSSIALLGGAMWSTRRRAEAHAAEAAEEEERLRVTLACISDAVIATDAQGRVGYLNPVAEAMTGWGTGEATGQPLGAVFQVGNEETRREVEHRVTRVLREGVVVGLANHTVLIAADGTERTIEDSAAPIKVGGGEVRGVVLVFRDVTGRREAERALRASGERLRQIVESAEDHAIFTIDLDGEATTWNSGARRLTGYDEAEIVGRGVEALHIPEDFERGVPVQEKRKAQEQGRAENEHRHVRKDGTRFRAGGLLMPMREADRLVGFLKIMRDMTEQKRTEQELEVSRERLDLADNSS